MKQANVDLRRQRDTVQNTQAKTVSIRDNLQRAQVTIRRMQRNAFCHRALLLATALILFVAIVVAIVAKVSKALNMNSLD